MWPKIGDFRIYSVVYALSVVAYFVTAKYWCRRRLIPPRIGYLFGVLYAFGMVVGARVLYDIFKNRFDIHNYLHIGYYVTDGMWGGPLAFLMTAVAWAFLHPARMRDLLDLSVLALPIPLILAKFACFLNGCCYGAPCSWPWCISCAEGSKAPPGIARHQTPLYEIMVLMAIVVFFQWVDHRRWNGRLILWFGLFYGIGRPLTEAFRVPDAARPQAGFLSASQAVCLAGATTAAALLILARPRCRDLPAAIPTP